MYELNNLNCLVFMVLMYWPDGMPCYVALR
jgi:hypothetical protein